MVDGVKEGDGCMNFVNGDWADGFWQEGMLHGYVKYRFGK